MAEKEVDRLTEELQRAIKEHNAKDEALKRQPLNTIQSENQNQEDEVIPEGGNSGKGKERERSPISNNQNIPRLILDEEHAAKRRVLQQRLREMRLVLHRVKFLQGDVYHVLGGQYSAAETEAYGVADEIRRDLLRGPLIFPLNEFSRLIPFPQVPKRTLTV